MDNLNIDKLNEIRKLKGYTLKELAKLTQIPHSTISKIFAGFNKNPSLSSLKKIARVLECCVDDFINHEIETNSAYYKDKQIYKISQEIYKNEKLKILLDVSKDLSQDDIQAVIEIAKRIQSSKR